MSTSDSRPILTSMLLVAVVLALAALFYIVQQSSAIFGTDKLAAQPESSSSATDKDTENAEVAQSLSLPVSKGVEKDGESASAAVTTTSSSSAQISETSAEIDSATSDQSLATEQQTLDTTVQISAAENLEGGDIARIKTPVKVPQSFSVKEAAKFFVPKEERAPGNLGGPPPFTEEMLSIMEQGSSNPAITPPPAPGGDQ